MTDEETAQCMLDDNCDDCPDCRLAVGVGQSINICKHLGFDDCEEMYDKVVDEIISPVELVDTLMERTETKNTEYHETFLAIKDLMTTPLGKPRTHDE
jgi:hypothetical protein